MTKRVPLSHSCRYWKNESVLEVTSIGHANADFVCSAEKSAALRKLDEDPGTTVMLASLKCASAGLNNQSCSAVILLEPWWNPAIEVSRGL